MDKYRKVRDKLAGDRRLNLRRSELAARESLLRVHSSDYVDNFLAGTLDARIMRRIGFPWSPELVTRTLASAGGTLLATQEAVETGFGGTLAGGTHHAFRNEGAGFCVFNDLATAIGWAREVAGICRSAVIDLDVHQGDGTAAIFEGSGEVFTLSLHGAQNFPFRKQKSTLDVPLPDGTGDEEYLRSLVLALEQVWDFGPDIVFYQAGVDTLGSDRLGRLSLTLSGLSRRDQLVIAEAKNRSVPLVITIGGGYAKPIKHTVEAHVQTFQIAAEIYFEDLEEAVELPESSPQPSSAPVP